MVYMEEDRKSKWEMVRLYNVLKASAIMCRDQYLLQLTLQSLLAKPLGHRKSWTTQATAALQAVKKRLWWRRTREQSLLRGMCHVMGRWMRQRP